jgi:hypothetical protein
MRLLLHAVKDSVECENIPAIVMMRAAVGRAARKARSQTSCGLVTSLVVSALIQKKFGNVCSAGIFPPLSASSYQKRDSVQQLVLGRRRKALNTGQCELLV